MEFRSLPSAGQQISSSNTRQLEATIMAWVVFGSNGFGWGLIASAMWKLPIHNCTCRNDARTVHDCPTTDRSAVNMLAQLMNFPPFDQPGGGQTFIRYRETCVCVFWNWFRLNVPEIDVMAGEQWCTLSRLSKWHSLSSASSSSSSKLAMQHIGPSVLFTEMEGTLWKQHETSPITISSEEVGHLLSCSKV